MGQALDAEQVVHFQVRLQLLLVMLTQLTLHGLRCHIAAMCHECLYTGSKHWQPPPHSLLLLALQELALLLLLHPSRCAC